MSPVAGGNMQGPYLEIVEQPVSNFRFRYRTEMQGTHGAILGASCKKTIRKTCPTVRVRFPLNIVYFTLKK